MSPGMTRFATDTGIVTARGEQKSHICADSQAQLVHRSPGRDVIRLGRHHKAGYPDVTQCQLAAVNTITSLKQIIVQKKLAQVFALHAVG